jgi:agmatinase
MTQIGIRGQGSSSRKDFEDVLKYGSTIIGPREFRKNGLEKIVERIPESARYYITIDCDVLDPALAPGTGTPSPGGLDYYELTDTLRGIAKRGEVIGFDFCEVAPVFDPTGVTFHLAAQVILEFIGAIFKERR